MVTPDASASGDQVITPSATTAGDQVMAEFLVLANRLYPKGDKRVLEVVLHQYETHEGHRNRLIEQQLRALDRQQSREDAAAQDRRKEMAHRHEVELARLRDERHRFWATLVLSAFVTLVGLGTSIAVLTGDPSDGPRIAALLLAIVSAGGGGGAAFRSLDKLPKSGTSGQASST